MAFGAAIGGGAITATASVVQGMLNAREERKREALRSRRQDEDRWYSDLKALYLKFAGVMTEHIRSIHEFEDQKGALPIDEGFYELPTELSSSLQELRLLASEDLYEAGVAYLQSVGDWAYGGNGTYDGVQRAAKTFVDVARKDLRLSGNSHA